MSNRDFRVVMTYLMPYIRPSREWDTISWRRLNEIDFISITSKLENHGNMVCTGKFSFEIMWNLPYSHWVYVLISEPDVVLVLKRSTSNMSANARNYRSDICSCFQNSFDIGAGSASLIPCDSSMCHPMRSIHSLHSVSVLDWKQIFYPLLFISIVNYLL